MKTIVTFIILIFSLSACSRQQQPAVKEYPVRDFYNNISIAGGAFSNDESKILFSSNESGIFNLYEINIADSSRRKLTNSETNSFFAYDYVPGTSQLVYGADREGNELTHVYLMNEDGSTTDLTPGEKEKAGFGGWSKDKQYMYFSSTRRDPRFFDLYRTKIGDWKPELLYQNQDGLDVHSVSVDNNFLLLGRNITSSENELFLYDRRTKKSKVISDPVQKGSYSGSGFTNDGKYFYYITDAGSEFAYLVRYETATADTITVYKTNWDVAGSYLSENNKYIVIAINEDGKNKLVLRENETGKNITLPEIQDGNILDVNISESEKSILLTVGTSRTPADLYLFDLGTSAVKRLTNSLNPAINSDDLVQAEVVRYKSFDGLEIPAIFYKPLNASAGNKVPALVYVHGGPGGQTRISYSSNIQSLVNHGYAVLGVNNRGSSGYGKTFYKMDDRDHGGNDLKDCIWGKKWLMEQEYIDTGKIGIIGGSYGGYMTMAAMTFTPLEFKAGVNIFGVTNWIRTLKSIPPDWEANRKALYDEMGDPYTEDSVMLYRISPLFHAEQIKNPVIVLQGANDRRVLQVESDEIVAAMKKNNIPVEYVIFPDEGHGFVKKENNIKSTESIISFLDKYLKHEEKIDK
ncbi:MAG TPA: prolyl oligopeptidase family serine peptidase [Bacteroidales bacterium]|nr:prolyl oligopeptidase family serine peptidase [Bacteroidales bacterium]